MSYEKWEQTLLIDLTERERTIAKTAYEAGDRARLTKVLTLFSADLLARDPSLQKMQKAIEEM